jgi:DNA polymerase elongation subunit (family B)
MVMSDRTKEMEEEEETIEGGYVESHPGFYNNMLSIDATSEYPSLIRMINISPETKVMNPDNVEGLIKGHSPGLYYKKEQGILPKIVSDIFAERKQFKKLMEDAQTSGDKDSESYYDSQQLIRKILINSVFGCCASTYFHYFDLDNAGEITRGGRTVIQYVADCINKYFSNEYHKVAKKFYPNSNLLPGDIPEKIVKVIDTDSILGNSIVITSIGNVRIEYLYNMFESNAKETSKDNFTSKVVGVESLSFSNKFNLEYKNIEYNIYEK